MVVAAVCQFSFLHPQPTTRQRSSLSLYSTVSPLTEIVSVITLHTIAVHTDRWVPDM